MTAPLPRDVGCSVSSKTVPGVEDKFDEVAAMVGLADDGMVVKSKKKNEL